MSRLAIVPILKFDIFWDVTQDGQTADEGDAAEVNLHEHRKRDWVGLPPAGSDGPPDQMMEYILTALEPIDLHLGTILHAAQANPEVEEQMGLRFLKRLMARLYGASIHKSDLTAILAGEVADAVLLDLPKRRVKKIARNLMRGLCQILLRERSIRTRTILEVHAMQSLRAAAGVAGLDQLIGKELALAVVYEAPDQEAPVAEPDEVHSDSPG